MKMEKFIKKWEKAKAKGKRKYVLISGINSGFAMFVGYIIGNSFYSFIRYEFYLNLAYLFGGFIGGVIGSFMRWKLNEEKYEQLDLKDILDKC